MRAMGRRRYTETTPQTRARLPEQPRSAMRVPRCMRFVLIALFVVGCTHDVRVRYPAPPDAPTGTLVLRLTEAANVSVAVNGQLIVDDEKTDKIVIENLPVGG